MTRPSKLFCEYLRIWICLHWKCLIDINYTIIFKRRNFVQQTMLADLSKCSSLHHLLDESYFLNGLQTFFVHNSTMFPYIVSASFIKAWIFLEEYIIDCRRLSIFDFNMLPQLTTTMKFETILAITIIIVAFMVKISWWHTRPRCKFVHILNQRCVCCIENKRKIMLECTNHFPHLMKIHRTKDFHLVFNE